LAGRLQSPPARRPDPVGPARVDRHARGAERAPATDLAVAFSPAASRQSGRHGLDRTDIPSGLPMLDPTYLLTDPMFYAVAVPAVVLVGLSKGGLGGAAALLGVPIMALVMHPVQAAAMLLPILLVMDAVSLWTWRHWRDWTTLKLMLPGAMAGIGLGWLTAAFVTADFVRLIVGMVAIAFVARWLLQRWRRANSASRHNVVLAAIWSSISGFTSFVAHAGGPPYQVYAMGLKQDPRLYTGTAAIYFATMNAVKLVPYVALGQLDTTTLTAAAVLMPLAPVATLAGAWIVKRMSADIFYPFMYGMVLLVGLKLVWDSAAAFWG
jgi:uncharacterized protein